MSARSLRGSLALAVLVVGASAARSAEANPHLARALAEHQAVDYDAARRSLEAALAWGQNGPGELVRIEMLSGEIAAAIGDREAALAHFRRALAIDPGAALPAGVAPKIQEPFEGARASLRDHPPLRIGAEVQPRGGRGRVLVVVVASDPLHLVAGVRASGELGGARFQLEGRGAGRSELALPGEAPLSIALAAIDAFGNRLVELEVKVAAPARPARPARRPIHRRPLLWAGTGAVFAAAGGALALGARSARADRDALLAAGEPEYAEVRALDDRGRRETLLANVGLAVGGACAVVAGILLVSDRRGAEPRPVVTARPFEGGAVVGISIGF